MKTREGRLDTRLDKTVRGSLWRHPKTGGWYWRVKPPNEAKFRNIPLVPLGKKHATKSRTHAEQCRRRLWKEWQKKTKEAPKSVQHWLQQFAEWNSTQAATRQVQYNCHIIEEFVALQGITKCWQIQVEHVQNYLTALQKKRRSLRTIQAHRNTLRKFCRYLVLREQLETNPVDLHPVKPPSKQPPRFLDDAQQRAFLRHAAANAPGWLHAAVQVGLYGGPRMGEIRALRGMDIAKTAMTIRAGKTGEYRIVPLDHPIIEPALAKLLQSIRGPRKQYLFPQMHKPDWVGTLRQLTEDLPVFGELPGRRAGNQWHLLRSTWAVNCARKGATLWQLMAWGGWKTPQTVMRYVNIAQAAGR